MTKVRTAYLYCSVDYCMATHKARVQKIHQQDDYLISWEQFHLSIQLQSCPDEHMVCWIVVLLLSDS